MQAVTPNDIIDQSWRFDRKIRSCATVANADSRRRHTTLPTHTQSTHTHATPNHGAAARQHSTHTARTACIYTFDTVTHEADDRSSMSDMATAHNMGEMVAHAMDEIAAAHAMGGTTAAHAAWVTWQQHTLWVRWEHTLCE